MINLSESTRELIEQIEAAGYSLRWHNNEWLASNELAVQAIIDSYDLLAFWKKEKVEALKSEGLKRIQQVYPAIANFDELKLVRDIILSITPSSRALVADMLTVSNIYQTGLDAIIAINAFTTVDQVKAYDVVNTPAWP